MTQFNAPAYDVQRPTGRCALTDRPLEPNESYIATLVEVEPSKDNPSGLQRLDVALDAWNAGRKPDRVFCFWKATVSPPNEKKKLFVDDGVLMTILERLADATEPQRLAFRFVLALILLRKKLVRYDGTQKRDVTIDGQPTPREFWLLTPKLDVSKGIFGKWNEAVKLEVLDPHLDEQQITQVTTQLGEILEAEL